MDHKSDAHRETLRPDRQGSDRGRLLTPKLPGEKTAFDKVLQDTNQASDSDFSWGSGQDGGATETREAVRHVASQQERFGRPKEDLSKKAPRDRDSDREDTGKTGGSREVSTARTKEADKRVIGRSSMGQRQQGEGDQGGKGAGTGSGRQGRAATPMPAEMAGMKGGEGAILQNVRGRFEMELQAAQSIGTAPLAKPTPKQVKDPNIIPKAVMDQLVQYCRIVTKTDGDKEIDMQLHEEVFKGLRLKVAMSKGRLNATFTTQSQEVLDLFNSQKAEIRKALSEKGIEVSDINVLMV